jgi:hypothetical protein
LSGIRLTTGIGIAVGGVGGALAALLGAPATAPSPPPIAPPTVATATASVAPPSPPVPTPSSADEVGRTEAVASAAAAPASASAAAAPASASVAPAAASAAPTPSTVAASPGAAATPPLDVPVTREALLKAELYCDQKKLYDECSRAAQALEQGTAGPADATQARRFRKIALTYLVADCEVGDPHACFIMAAKYRAGTELPLSAVRAEALQKRGLELCRLRSAPECPAP